MELANELIDSVLTGNSSEDISDKIKEILYVKSSEKIDDVTPYIASSLFNDQEE